MTHAINGDRRANRRFDFDLELRFTAADQNGSELAGSGHTSDISRGGIRFRTDTPPPENAAIRLWIAWPFLLQNVCPLELVARGCVLRTDLRGTVIRTSSYEFRTRGVRSFSDTNPVEVGQGIVA